MLKDQDKESVCYGGPSRFLHVLESNDEPYAWALEKRVQALEKAGIKIEISAPAELIATVDETASHLEAVEHLLEESRRHNDRIRAAFWVLLTLFILQMLTIMKVHSEPLRAGVQKTKIASGVHIRKDGMIGIREDWNRVITRIHPGSPAQLAGLKIGDRVVTVDGVKSKEIIGPVGGSVLLEIERDGEIIQRRIIRVPKSEIKPYGSEIVQRAEA